MVALGGLDSGRESERLNGKGPDGVGAAGQSKGRPGGTWAGAGVAQRRGRARGGGAAGGDTRVR